MAADLSISTASAMLAGSPPTSTIPDVRASLAEIHSDHPQRSALASAALDEIEAALARLAALGHRFFLSEADPAPMEAWPRMVYRGGETELAEDQKAFDGLTKDGWKDHPAETPSVTKRGA